MMWFDDGSDRFRLMIWSIVDEWVDMLMLMNESICWWYCWLMIMSDPVDDVRLMMIDWWSICWCVDEWIDICSLTNESICWWWLMIKILLIDWWWLSCWSIYVHWWPIDDIRLMTNELIWWSICWCSLLMMFDWWWWLIDMLFVMNESVCWWYCWLMIMSDPVDDVRLTMKSRYVDDEE